MCAPMGGICIQCPLRIINQSVGRDASSRRQNSQISFPPLIYAPYCKPQSALSVDISFFPAVYYTSVCANFLGKGGYGMSVKAQVLSALDAARGRYISGQELADQLGVSRAAIWKAVTALRADGTPIEAITNRGYALPHGADLLNADAITALLAPAVAQAVQITVVDRLPGTNAALRTQATNGAPEGLVLIAQAQSAGRGRRGHSFFSPPGGLYLSILLRPAFSTRQSPQITALAAVAAARAAEQLCGTPIQIKWVNDLWKNGKKVCGILTEAAVDLESGMLDYAVLGLGFNLVQPSGGWPKELAAVAGSLFDSAPAPGARAALAAAFLNEFWALYHTGLRGSWLDDYRRRQALTGRHVTLIPNGSEPRGATVLGIDDDCRLLVRCDGDLAPTAFGSDEIRVIPELGALA